MRCLKIGSRLPREGEDEKTRRQKTRERVISRCGVGCSRCRDPGTVASVARWLERDLPKTVSRYVRPRTWLPVLRQSPCAGIPLCMCMTHAKLDMLVEFLCKLFSPTLDLT
jgi:hypothetical protein